MLSRHPPRQWALAPTWSGIWVTRLKESDATCSGWFGGRSSTPRTHIRWRLPQRFFFPPLPRPFRAPILGVSENEPGGGRRRSGYGGRPCLAGSRPRSADQSGPLGVGGRLLCSPRHLPPALPGAEVDQPPTCRCHRPSAARPDHAGGRRRLRRPLQAGFIRLPPAERGRPTPPAPHSKTPR